MAIEQEIEFKQLLDENTYRTMKTAYFSDTPPFTQTNFYIDTPDFQLMSHKMALRIRVRSDKSNELTLKVPGEVGLTEYNYPTSYQPKTSAQLPEHIIPNDIRNVLDQFHIDASQLTILGYLTTHRLETTTPSGLVVLDYSEYLGTEDFELEFEVDDYHDGYEAFTQILDTYHLTHKTPLNKVQRFFKRRQSME
ncbi:CYTH domain-containing protein [Staphylococcus muscae]|uniref:Adenylate cyclase n=1 Tax=Staphylococcus muscae TaxID=1294 RepID=A0A240C0J7_9STAP|nr:CYTH domain-containing protein [Staphylococcus muscae]AVQ34524.1 CYTH domain-containing protein [Staphylococcus muscae]PNZ04996.1 CYTH domain-containing protein [Staphylococcus muscae]GGA90944.1 adenylate cyclase [Staphylococcus muscae]SNW01142.1 adenylate cyclase [Staphylococcus muscae]